MIPKFRGINEFFFRISTLVRVVLPLLVLFLACLSRPSLGQDPATKDESDASKIQAALEKMSLAQKVGQLFILGFPGTTFPGSVKGLLDEFQPGALIAFSRNIRDLNQIRSLNRESQNYSRTLNGLPLFIMLDQEGGAVARIKTSPPVPSALAMGETDNPDLIKEVGRVMGGVLHTLGFNMNLAPVLDIGNARRRSFIANRAFSAEPEKVTEMAVAFSNGLIASDIIPTAKHFPGHGGLVQDSHKSTPTKLASLEELEKGELTPFREFAKLKAPAAVMVAHVAYPNVDPSGLPAAFSSKIIGEVLRQNLRYEGLVITDDIEMMGANTAGSIGERAIKAIEAGCDMVMVAWSPSRQRRAYRDVLRAVRSGRISEERLNQSLKRILFAKLSKGLSAEPEIAEPHVLGEQLAALRSITHKIHRINFEKSYGKYSPPANLYGPDRPVLIFSSDDMFLREFQSVAPRNPVHALRLTPSSLSSVEKLLRVDSDRIAIYYATGTKTALKLNELPLSQRSRIIVINGAYPGAIEDPNSFQLMINLNSPDPTSARWIAEKLFEDAQPKLDEEERLPAAENADEAPPPGS